VRENQAQLTVLLQGIAESLDIPPSKYQQAVERYTAVGNWLKVPGTALAQYAPDVYPQGSLRLGTIVRPLREGKEADYDVDLVCQLRRDKASVDPGAVKQSVGDRLKENGRYKEMLDKEGNRCWTLDYAEEDGIGFHVDSLPCVPEAQAAKGDLVLKASVAWDYAQHAVAITDKDKKAGTYSWKSSNPRGYAAWFDKVKAKALALVERDQRTRLFLANRTLYANEQAVPDELIRTPLQRAIQLLKRHRDMRFAGHEWEDDKPISMVITTLAALTYQAEPDLLSALMGIVSRMESGFGGQLVELRQGKWWIPNPVDPEENFADRWNEPGSHRADAFKQWVAWAKEDLLKADELGLLDDQVELLSEAFGRDHVERAAKGLTESRLPVRRAVADVPALTDASHCQPPQWAVPFRLPHRVAVSATVHAREGASHHLWRFSSRPLPKGVHIRFRAETDARPPFSVKWQVVNTGAEARAAGMAQLRGGFNEGEGQTGAVRWERTAYRGTHWVEAFVVQNGACVARSGRVYVKVR
jgi:hypothetical protein